jgi:hypothetical protein
MLPISDLKKLVEWKPIASGFGRDEENTYETKVRPIFSRIENLDRTEVLVMADGGLSNYASAFVHNRKNDSGNIEGLYIYLSLLAPIAAMGRDAAYISGKSLGFRMIEPGFVLNQKSLKTDFEISVWSAIEAGGYKLLSAEDATTPLPKDLVPFEYCLNKEPWDRVFHALFSDTD